VGHDPFGLGPLGAVCRRAYGDLPKLHFVKVLAADLRGWYESERDFRIVPV
jgi:hypothetical protein